MKITSVKVKLKNVKNERVKAGVSIVFDNCFVVNGIRVVEGTKGLFVAMPSEPLRTEEGGYRDIVHPINAECRKMVHDAVMAQYEKELEKAANEPELTEAE